MQPVINRHYRRNKGHAETGMVFIVLGVIFLFMKLDIIHFEWHWYMLVSIAFVIGGLVEMVQFKRPHKIFEGFFKVMVGGWFYAAFSGLWGITPANSWPLIMIFVGAGMVMKSIFRPRASLDDRSKSE